LETEQNPALGIILATKAGASMSRSSPPQIQRILETVLYVADLDRAEAFYTEVMGLPVIHSDPRMRAFDVNGAGTLLLFVEGQSLEPIETPMGTIPPHDARGPAHIAFSIAPEALAGWERHLGEAKIALEGRTHWPRGGESVYFRDPDGHLLELATPGLWKGY
jgi:catechol 2,3-dioxygenase-like lactoylglutathione lyase family enzyme